MCIPAWLKASQMSMTTDQLCNILTVLRMYWAVHHREPLGEIYLAEWWAKYKRVAPIFLLFHETEKMTQEAIDRAFLAHLDFVERKEKVYA